jgi:hypothetical protein
VVDPATLTPAAGLAYYLHRLDVGQQKLAAAPGPAQYADQDAFAASRPLPHSTKIVRPAPPSTGRVTRLGASGQ